MIERALGKKAAAAGDMVTDELVFLAEWTFPKWLVGAKEDQ